MIDELIQHCIREIGSDGEAGSELDRVHQFVHDFHAQPSSQPRQPRQNVDNAYQVFVLQQLLQQPDVHLGLHTPGVPTMNARKGNITRKAENNGVATKAESITAPTLEFDWVDLLPPTQQQRPLPELQQQYGDKLRLVLSAALIKRLLLGPREVNLSTPNYRFLQLVCRARQHAVKSVDLGTVLRYDQKTIFYLAKKLIDLGLVVKVKAPETGTTASYFVATQYMQECPLLLDQQNADIGADRDIHISTDAVPSTDNDADIEAETDLNAPTIKVEDGDTDVAPLQFEPVSPEKALLWVSSRPELVRLRIYLVCGQSSSKVTARIGLTKRIRIEGGAQLKRPMNGLLERAIVDGYLEVVRIYVSSSASSDNGYKGLRMTALGENEMQSLLNGSSPIQVRQEVADAEKRNAHMSHELDMREPRLVREVTLERWLHEEVANAGSAGRSLRQLASSIHASGHVHRMLEGIIQRSEEATSDPSMADLRIRSVHEHNLRVRSTRFFSHHAWVLQCANEGYLQSADRDLLQAAGGNSAVHDHTSTWDTVEQLSSTVAALASDLYDSSPKKKSGVKLGRPPGSTKKRQAEDTPTTPIRRGRPPKKPKTDIPAVATSKSLAQDDLEDSQSTVQSTQTPLVSSSDTMAVESDAMAVDSDAAPCSAVPPAPSISDLLETPVKQEASASTPAAPTPSSLLTPRSASDRRLKTNLTRLRSAHAIVDCVRLAGGAMDSLLIPKQLLTYVEQHGYAADSQLLNLREKRIRDRALSAAIDDDLLRRTYIRLDRPDAHQPQRQIIYLPSLPESVLKQYCDAVLAGREGWTLDKTNQQTALMHVTDKVELDFTEALRLTDRKPWHVQDTLSIHQLPNDPALLTALRGHFMGVPSVLGQHVGHLGGAMLRLKVFHMACAQIIAAQHPNTSPDSCSIRLSHFWTQAPLDLYVALVSVRSPTQTAESALLDPDVRTRPVQELTGDISVALRLAPATMSEVKLVFYSLASQLVDLGIATVTKSADGDSMSPLIELKQRLPIYDWSVDADDKPLEGVMDVGLLPDRIHDFWINTQKHCLKRKVLSTSIASTTMSARSPKDDDEQLLRKVPDELKQAMSAIKAWRPFHLLRPSQTRFLERIDLDTIRQKDGALSTDALEKMAFIILAPATAVKQYLEEKSARAREGEPNEPRARSVSQIRWPLKLSYIDVPTTIFAPIATNVAKAPRERVLNETERDRQGRQTTLKKARELRQRRDEQFQSMVEQAFALAPAAEVLRDRIERALRGIRKRFVVGDAQFSRAEEVRKAIHRAVGSGAGVKIKMPAIKNTVANGTADSNMTSATAKPRQQRSGRRSFVPTNYWDARKNELLRDAVVILRARDRARGRSDWSALMQVVDAADQTKARGFVLTQWRNQYHRMRYLYGEEGYLSALERRWAQLSSAARASGDLVDPNYPSASEFDLNAQIAFLRAHTDKNEIQSSLAKPATKDPLPLQLNAGNHFEHWKHEFVPEDSEKKWEVFFANELGMSARRFEVLLANAFSIECNVTPRPVQLVAEQEQFVLAKMAEAAVRIIIATDEGVTTWDGAKSPDSTAAMEHLKSQFCLDFGSTEIESATVRLLESKLIRPLSTEINSRRQPGTNLVFTDEYLRLLPGPLASTQSGSGLALTDLQQTLKDKHDKLSDVSRHWLVEPVEMDGDASALITLMDMRDGLVQATLDTRPFAALRQHHAFNARVLNDDELEALITVQARPDCAGVLTASRPKQFPSLPSDDSVLRWADLEPEGVQAEWQMELSAQLTAGDGNTALMSFASTTLIQSGPLGIALDSIPSSLAYSDLLRLIEADKPLAFFSPLAAAPTLVASIHVRHYTIHLPRAPHASEQSRRTLPHVYTSLTQPKVPLWHRLLDQLVALVAQRPGTNLAHLAARFTAATIPPADTPIVGVSFLDVYTAVHALIAHDVLEMQVVHASSNPALWCLQLRHTPDAVWTGFAPLE